MDGVDNAGEPITVSAYSARYAKAFGELLRTEGGFVDDPADRGGATKYGISLRFLKAEGAFDGDGPWDRDGIADFDLDFDGDIDGRDVRKLTIGDARYLYLRCFWQALDCESFARPIGEMLFDQGVNGGNHAAKVLLQRALNVCLARTGYNLVEVDGRIGSETRAALHRISDCPRMGVWAIVQAYREVVADRYRAIVRRNPSQAKFLKGWLNRADRLGRPSSGSGRSA